MLEIKKIKAIKSHLNIYKTYKELNNILPFGYIKTKVSPSQKYFFKKQPILINLEKEKNNIISPTKITKNLLYNKNIYIFSEENDKSKKMISKLKKYYSYNNKYTKINSIKSESNIISDIENTLSNSRNSSNLNNYIINANTINFQNKINQIKGSKENEQSKNDLNINVSRNEIGLYSNNIRNSYRSSSINNYFMKNNIYLPSIINRLKNNLPRYQRENNGFLLNGFGKNTTKEINTNINSDNNNFKKYKIQNENNFINKYKFIKSKSGLSYIESYEIKNNINQNIGSIKKKHKNFLYKKNKTFDDDTIEIMGIKRLNKKVN